MKIAIIAAMSEELEPFRQAHTTRETVFEKGKTRIEKISEDLYLVASGIGKANAAATAAWLCDKIAPELIINTGTTGGFQAHVGLADVVITDRFVYSDVDATGFDYQWGQVPQMPSDYPVNRTLLEKVQKIVQDKQHAYTVHIGTIVTADSFMSNVETISSIQEKMGHITASDMESAAIAQIASFYDTPVLNVRGISDHVGDQAPDTFKQTVHRASQHAYETVTALVDAL